jgi:hypothetical protein
LMRMNWAMVIQSGMLNMFPRIDAIIVINMVIFAGILLMSSAG